MDIRIDTKLLQHPKTIKLYRRLGAEGVLSLIRLWLWAAENRPTGYLLGLSEEDIDLIAGAGQTGPDQTGPDQTRPTSFCAVAKELSWIDVAEDGTLVLHEWSHYNPWAADAPTRSDKARFSKLASVAPAAYIQLVKEGKTSITADEYREVIAQMGGPPAKRQRTDNAAPTPNPSPNPSQSLDNRPDPGGAAVDTVDKILRAYRAFPGYRAELEVKERGWIEGLIQRFGELDIVEEIRKAHSWITLKEDFSIRNSRAYLIKWLERVQKERN